MNSNAKVTIRLDNGVRAAFLCMARLNGTSMQKVLAACAKRYTKRAFRRGIANGTIRIK
ncbi:MAG: hypothetical protein Q4E34_03850 [Synergistaceae bacterium]|nr:hypothetical protein [Synergistaceae bacterium]